MRRRLMQAQVLALVAGTLFAWYTVLGDFRRFFAAGGWLFQFAGCAVPNPLLTPCLYGAIVFAVALAWSLAVLCAEEAGRPPRQKALALLLGAGTAFAWSNFAYQMHIYSRARPGAFVGCSGVTTHPIHTPCFTGAVLYLTALIVALLVSRAMKSSPAAAAP